MDTKTTTTPPPTNVPPPTDEEEIAYIYNRARQAVHKWPGCRTVDRMHPANIEYLTPSELGKYRLEHGVIHRCRLCFGKPRS